jgi:dihydroxyacid dehydratase/phosphogluconate dehydratase
MVTAIMSPGECTGQFQPNSFTVCVEMLGSGTPQCKFTPVYDAVQVFFTPYRKGATYASTARECGNVFPAADQSCSSQGPYSTTL